MCTNSSYSTAGVYSPLIARSFLWPIMQLQIFVYLDLVDALLAYTGGFFLFRFGFVCLFVFEFVCVKLCFTLKQVMVVNVTCLASHMTVSKVRAAF